MFQTLQFIVRSERDCPVYSVDDELKVSNKLLTVPPAKTTCLVLAQKILTTFSAINTQHIKNFDCGGCDGKIVLEVVQEKAFVLPQMQRLKDAEKAKRSESVKQIIGMLRECDNFAAMESADVEDLAGLLTVKYCGAALDIIRSGEIGDSLYIVLSGTAEIIGTSNNLISSLPAGGIFGEMSLLSGSPVISTVRVTPNTCLGRMTEKDFKHLLTKYPNLQSFFYNLIVDRVRVLNERCEIMNRSGATGKIAEIAPVEMLQLVNRENKTGTLSVEVEGINAYISIREGEVINAVCEDAEGFEALVRILSFKTGYYVLSPDFPFEDMHLEPLGPFMNVLMKAVQEIDERK